MVAHGAAQQAATFADLVTKGSGLAVDIGVDVPTARAAEGDFGMEFAAFDNDLHDVAPFLESGFRPGGQ